MDAPGDLRVVAFHGLFLNAGRVSWEAERGLAGVKPLIIPCRVNSSPCSSLYTYTSHINRHLARVTKLSVSQDHIGMIKASAKGQSQLGDIYSDWRGINLLNKLNLNSAGKKKHSFPLFIGHNKSIAKVYLSLTVVAAMSL